MPKVGTARITPVTGTVAYTASTANTDGLPVNTSLSGTYAVVTVDETGAIVATKPLIILGDATGTSDGDKLVLTLSNSGVLAGSYAKVVVNSRGIVTSGGTLSTDDIVAALGYKPLGTVHPALQEFDNEHLMTASGQFLTTAAGEPLEISTSIADMLLTADGEPLTTASGQPLTID